MEKKYTETISQLSTKLKNLQEAQSAITQKLTRQLESYEKENHSLKSYIKQSSDQQQEQTLDQNFSGNSQIRTAAFSPVDDLSPK